MQVNPYLNFDGRAEEAIAFYKKAVGAKVTALVHFKDQPKSDAGCPGGVMPPETDNKVMHVTLEMGSSTVMGSDCHCTGKPNFAGISLALSARDQAECDRVFTGLAEGGKISVPLGKTFFSSSFGVLTDRFGVTWMVMVPQS
jgi:PhnB protein